MKIAGELSVSLHDSAVHSWSRRSYARRGQGGSTMATEAAMAAIPDGMREVYLRFEPLNPG